MKKLLIIAIAAATAAAVLMMSGCAALDTLKEKLQFEETQTEAGTDEIPEEEVSNSVTVGVFGFDTFNPLTTKSETVREAMQLVYEPLFELDEQMRPVPALAESYSVSPDGRTVLINLRQGVKWHDGEEFDSYDAAYTIKNIRSGNTEYTAALSDVADHRITDNYSIQLTLKRPVPNFVALLTFPIVKYQTPLTINQSYTPVGTGPFKFDGKLSTDKMQLSAFEEYRGGRAAVDRAYIVFAPDADKYHSMFEASEIDVITSETVDLTQYMPKGGISIDTFVTDRLTFLGFNLQSEELLGSETRIGLSQMINKGDIISSVLYSHAEAVDAPINPSSYLYHTDKTIFEADDISAREHLENDGWKLNSNGNYTRLVNNSLQALSFEILVNKESAEKTGVAEKIAEYFNKLGVYAEVDAVPYETYVSRINAHQFDVFIGEYELDPNLDLTPLTASGGNYFSYSNPDTDTLIAQIGMTSDEESQKILFSQLAEVMAQDMPFVPLYYREGSVLFGAKIKSGICPSVSAFYRGSAEWSAR